MPSPRGLSCTVRALYLGLNLVKSMGLTELKIHSSPRHVLVEVTVRHLAESKNHSVISRTKSALSAPDQSL